LRCAPIISDIIKPCSDGETLSFRGARSSRPLPPASRRRLEFGHFLKQKDLEQKEKKGTKRERKSEQS
jgi:hypothetical protein